MIVSFPVVGAIIQWCRKYVFEIELFIVGLFHNNNNSHEVDCRNKILCNNDFII